jgi:hypothetical protein
MTAGHAFISPVIVTACFRSIVKYRTAGVVASPPSLEYIIRSYIYDWSMILGFLLIFVLVLRRKYAYKTAVFMSGVWGSIGMEYAYHAIFVDTSDRYLYMAIIPALGLFMAMYHLRKENSLNW